MTGWTDRAACRGMDPAIFVPYVSTNGSKPLAHETETQALAVCARCKVRQECYHAAIAEGDLLAIRGGTTGRQRRQQQQALRLPLRPCGTHAAYVRGCRCHDCRAAHAAYRAQRRATLGRAAS